MTSPGHVWSGTGGGVRPTVASRAIVGVPIVVWIQGGEVFAHLADDVGHSMQEVCNRSRTLRHTVYTGRLP